MSNFEIAGFGAYVPDKILTNDDLAQMVDTSDEWIFSRTGIKRRHVAENENASDMAAKAARRILENAGARGPDVEVIIVSTGTADYIAPSTACLVQRAIGADKAFCFDLSAACTGFLYALSVARGMLDRYDNILVIGAEALSKITDWTDRATCVLFADGAGGCLLKKSNRPRRWAEFLRSDGTGAEAVTMGHFPSAGTTNAPCNISKIVMNGRELYNFVVNTVPDTILEVLKRAGMGMDEVKYIVPHQANLRMIESVAKKLGLPMEKFYTTIEEYANISSASIPVTLDRMIGEKLIGKGDIVLLTAFGGGLTCGSVLAEL
ncbi:MAG: ketoacyl-ACP synthase III [Defluviitaleaceae bacterium]|nr:ketoacyl-ACP synthase III [Defluviitaleaceae bacterium]